jgi:hypothetical protein
MAKRRRRTKTTSSGATSTLAELRQQARAVVKRFQRTGRQQLAAIEKEIARLNRRRQALLQEINALIGGVASSIGGRGRGAGSGRRGRRGRSSIDWNSVYARLPKGPFSAGDVRKLVSGVAAGTFSQRLTGWVRQKKLKRTGSRRGTRYTKAA